MTTSRVGIAEGGGTGTGSNYARSVAPSTRGASSALPNNRGGSSVIASERGGSGPITSSRMSRNSEGPVTLTAARLNALQLAPTTGRTRSVSHHHDDRSEAAMSTVSGTVFITIYIY